MSCAQGGSLFNSFAACVKTCTCGIDLRENAIDVYCNAAFTRNYSANAACMCLGMRCHTRCVEEALCPKTSEYDTECWKLEDAMPCDIGCAARSSSASSSSSSPSPAPPPLEWNFAQTPCVTDIRDEVTPLVGPQRVGPPQYLIGLIAGVAAILMLALVCCYVYRAMRIRRKHIEEHGAGEEGAAQEVPHGAPEGAAAQREPPREPQVETWTWCPVNGIALGIRSAPALDAAMVPGGKIRTGEDFLVSEEVVGEAGVIFLRLADGRGWAFDRRPGVGVMATKKGSQQSDAAQRDVDAMGVKDLKALIAEAGLSATGCLEKAELVEKAREAQRILSSSV